MVVVVKVSGYATAFCVSVIVAYSIERLVSTEAGGYEVSLQLVSLVFTHESRAPRAIYP